MGENTEKYITFSVPIKKKVHDNDKKEHDNDKKDKIFRYKLKFIDSYRFMQDSLSNLVDNVSEINDKEHENKFLDTIGFMIDSLSQSINKI